MKIATLNVNDVNKRLANLLAWLRNARPDVACLHELKASDDSFPVRAIGKARYGAVWRGKIMERRRYPCAGREPVLPRAGLPGDLADKQSRTSRPRSRACSSRHFTRLTATRSRARNSN